ncbi:helix-turn-helix transcriptional regulator [Haloactinospora alba]|nr:YafY family protein [Haloactinospora alba]
MAGPSERIVTLLSLLQDGRAWHVAELAERASTSPRTLRRDIHRLRDLGYPVARSSGGSYQLVSGDAMPPLVLTDEEALAATVGLRFAVLDQIEETTSAADTALAKLERLLPSRLRHRMEALLPPTPPVHTAEQVAPHTLRQLATSASLHQHVRFHYTDHAHQHSQRSTEPYHQVLLGRRWYLLGWDLDREDWRTYRVDRITDLTVPGTTFDPRDLPSSGVVRFVRDSHRFPETPPPAVVRFHAPAATLSELLPHHEGRLEDIDESSCRYTITIHSWEWLLITLTATGIPYRIESPDELVTYARDTAQRIAQAADP